MLNTLALPPLHRAQLVQEASRAGMPGRRACTTANCCLYLVALAVLGCSGVRPAVCTCHCYCVSPTTGDMLQADICQRSNNSWDLLIDTFHAMSQAPQIPIAPAGQQASEGPG